MAKKHRFVICNPELCIGCKACEKACVKSAYARGRLNKTRLNVLALETGKMPNQCRQCDDSPCANVCPTSALIFSKDSYIEFRESICIGCKLCSIACPYGAIHMNAESIPSIKVDEDDYKVGCAKGRKSVAMKCDLCAGREGVQACIDSCPKGALLLIDPINENHVYGKKLKGDQSRFIANVLGREYVEPKKEPEATNAEPKEQTSEQAPISEAKEQAKAETKEQTPNTQAKAQTDAPVSEPKATEATKVEETPAKEQVATIKPEPEVKAKDAKKGKASQNTGKEA